MPSGSDVEYESQKRQEVALDGADAEETRRFLSNMTAVGSKILGGAAGLAASTVVGLPVAGLIVSPFIAYQLEKAGKHLIESRIAPRQEMRVAAAYVLAFQKITERQTAGEKQRDDGFFDEDQSGRSAAEEITESSLAAARDAAEERKVPFVANLLAAIVFDDKIDRSTAHFFIATAERLSYRAYAIISLVGSGENRSNSGVQSTRPSAVNIDAVRSETYELITSGLIEGKDAPDAKNTIAVLGATDIEPRKLYLSELGMALYDAMGLQKANMDDHDVTAVEQVFNFIADLPAPVRVIDPGEF